MNICPWFDFQKVTANKAILNQTLREIIQLLKNKTLFLNDYRIGKFLWF